MLQVRSVRAQLKRLSAAEFRQRYPTPGALAKAYIPSTRQTPALDAIDAALVDLADAPGATGRQMVFIPPQEGKLVADETPVPTPAGWVRHGDLKPGDVVFHPSGRQIKVAEVHPPAEASLRVHFSDHTSVLVHPAHEWTVWDRSYRAYKTRETRDMARQALASGEPGKRGHRYRFQLPFREALDLPDLDLPIDPYTLGVWLGDGSSTKAAVTHHPADRYVLAYPETARCVHPTTGIITTYYGGGLWRALKDAGVYGTKHIPAPYLRASEAQRRALLAGLIDTDGHVSAAGQVSFDNTNERLVRDTAELIRTLGYRAHVHRPTPPKLSTSGIQGVQEMWRVTYTPHDQGPARLARKTTTRLGMRRRVAITAITEEAPQVGRCITVESEDGLYLVGEGMTPTHNSTRTSCWFPLWLLAQDPTLRIAIVSYAANKAERWGKWIRRMIESHPELGIELQRDSRAVDAYETTQGGRVLSVGISGGITGEPVDVMIIDDPLAGRAEAESPTYRERAWDWWESNGSTRLSARGRVVLMLTRWHADDLAGRLLKEEPGVWNVLRIPAIRDPNIPLVRGSDGASVYSPQGELISVQGRAPGYFLELKTRRSLYTWNSIYMQTPVAAEGNLFHRDDFRYWVSLGRDRSHHDPVGGLLIELDGARRYVGDMTRFITMDLAASVKTSADWTVASVWAISLDGQLVLLDRKRERIGESAHWDLLRPLCVKWAAPDVYVERGFIGATLVIDATKAGIRVQPVTPESDKVTRAIPATNRVRAHTVFFPAAADWLDEWCDEIAGFPTWANDDQVDTLAYAARIASAHWTPPAYDPDRFQALERPVRSDTDRAFESATGLPGSIDFSRVDW